MDVGGLGEGKAVAIGYPGVGAEGAGGVGVAVAVADLVLRAASTVGPTWMGARPGGEPYCFIQ